MDFGNKLKNLRKNKKLSQSDFAKIIGVTRSSIANYETNRNYPNNDVLQRISKVLDVSIDYLLNETSIKKTKTSLENDLKDLCLTKSELLHAIKMYKCVVQHLPVPSSFEGQKIDIFDFKNKIVKAFNAISMYSFERFSHKSYNWSSNNFLNNSDFLDFIENKSNSEILDIVNSLDIDRITNDYTSNTSNNNVSFPNNFLMIPIYGQISAGIPNWAEQNIEGALPIDPDLFGIVNPQECFFLRINGESMNKIIRNGAYALIRKQEIAENGDIVAVLVNGYDATLKKFSKQNDLVILEPMSNDPSFTTQVYTKDTEIKILGKYIGKFEINQ